MTEPDQRAREGNTVVKEETVRLDYARLRNKSFVECTLVYGGGLPPRMVDCDFIDSTFAFEGSAQNTLQFMAALARSDGQGRNLILSMLGITPDG